MVLFKNAVSSLLLVLASRNAGAATVFVCPMHPEVVSDSPGFCPKCKMKLDPKPQISDVALWA